TARSMAAAQSVEPAGMSKPTPPPKPRWSRSIRSKPCSVFRGRWWKLKSLKNKRHHPLILMSETSHRPDRKPLNLGIANFKAFGPHPQNIPLKPITLVFGPNSGGKSSLLHYLLWLKDVVCPPHG